MRLYSSDRRDRDGSSLDMSSRELCGARAHPGTPGTRTRSALRARIALVTALLCGCVSQWWVWGMCPGIVGGSVPGYPGISACVTSPLWRTASSPAY
eukprot:3297493-Rhodomonas_salina.1